MSTYRTATGGSINLSGGRADARPTDDGEKAAAARSRARITNAWHSDEDVGSFSREVEAKLASGAFDDPAIVWKNLEAAARSIAEITHRGAGREAEVRRLIEDVRRRVNLARQQAGKAPL